MRAGAVRWLYSELPELVANGIIDTVAADRLREHYGPIQTVDSSRRTAIVVGVLGALLTGSGIVLLVAHNWDSLSQVARLFIAVAILLAGQAVAGWTLWRHRESVAWTEGAAIFMASTLASSIALIHQIYQLQIETNEYLLGCTILMLPMVYLLRSRVAAMLVGLGATSGLISDEWRHLELRDLTIFLGLLLATVPFLVVMYREHAREVRTALTGWVAVGCLAISFSRLAAAAGGEFWIPLYTGLFGAMFAFGLLRSGASSGALWRRPWQGLGALGTGVLLLVLGFENVWTDPLRHTPFDSATGIAITVLALTLVASCGFGAYRLYVRGDRHYALLALTPWVAGVSVIAGWDATASALSISVFGFVAGLLICIEGLRRDHLGTANAGLLLIVAILTMRFVDSEWSFLSRGIGFVVLGLSFLVVNAWMLKRRSELRS